MVIFIVQVELSKHSMWEQPQKCGYQAAFPKNIGTFGRAKGGLESGKHDFGGKWRTAFVN